MSTGDEKRMAHDVHEALLKIVATENSPGMEKRLCDGYAKKKNAIYGMCINEDKTMTEVTPEELEKRVEVEQIKDTSNYLRGTLVKSLQDPLTGALAEDDAQLSAAWYLPAG